MLRQAYLGHAQEESITWSSPDTDQACMWTSRDPPSSPLLSLSLTLGSWVHGYFTALVFRTLHQLQDRERTPELQSFHDLVGNEWQDHLLRIRWSCSWGERHQAASLSRILCLAQLLNLRNSWNSVCLALSRYFHWYSLLYAINASKSNSFDGCKHSRSEIPRGRWKKLPYAKSSKVFEREISKDEEKLCTGCQPSQSVKVIQPGGVWETIFCVPWSSCKQICRVNGLRRGIYRAW